MNGRLLLLSLSGVVLAGCGGGASLVPTVTVIPPDFGVESESPESGDTVAQTDAGTETPAAGGVGNLTGRVVLEGAAPSLPLLIAKGADIKDGETCAAEDLPDERLILGAGNGVANVFVYLKRAPKGAPKSSAPSEPAVFDQKYCRFLPHCLLVHTGQTVRVLSDDPVAHNTHTYPKKSTGVSSTVDPGDREGKLEIVYGRAEVEPFPVTCDFHGWMKAYHLPLDHTFAAVTDADGNFSIPDLPAGDHDFVVWHEAADGGYVERALTVSVKPGDNAVEISYPASKLSL